LEKGEYRSVQCIRDRFEGAGATVSGSDWRQQGGGSPAQGSGRLASKRGRKTDRPSGKNGGEQDPN